VIGLSQRPLPDNTQHSQETYFHARSGIRTRNPSKQAAAGPRLRPRSNWDRRSVMIHYYFYCIQIGHLPKFIVQVFQTFTVTQPAKQSECSLSFSQKSAIKVYPDPVQPRHPVPVISSFMLPFLLLQCHPCNFFPDIGLNLRVLHPLLATCPVRLIVHEYSTV